jgi:primosomal protein N' (replication factor Y) (superfamily II helicase)
MFARVAIESPLPQLDRLFDYEIPADMEVVVGCRVNVPFGNSPKSGFVVELSETTDWVGKVAQITEVVSPLAALTPTIYALVRAVADRQASTFGDIIGSAIPVRAVRAEKAWLARTEGTKISTPPELPAPNLAKLSARIVEPRLSRWVDELLASSSKVLLTGKSAIVALPDFRDIALFVSRASHVGLAEHILQYSVEGRTQSYEAFLAALDHENPRIVVGSRNSLYAPVDAGGIFIWDDGDQSHQDQQSPYATSREIALIRQKLTDCQLTFFSHARSVEVQRLVEIGYLTECSSDFAKPNLSISDGEFRVDSAAWIAIREGLKTGPVLVQVSSVGVAKSLYCKNCSTRAMCAQCHGPLWINPRGETKCRWCNAFAMGASCATCKGTEFRYGKPGATRTVAEFGKSFPGAKVTEVTADQLKVSIDSKPQIVVATPGIEPVAAGGYSAVVILDAQDALARDSLKATEDALRSWANAIALLADSGRAVIVGVLGELATKLPLWQLRELISEEYAERTALSFPPAVRVLSATGTSANVKAVRAELESCKQVQILGESPVENAEVRLLARFSYAAGAEVTGIVRAAQLKLASGQKRYNAKSGRPQRPVTVKLDDPQVL